MDNAQVAKVAAGLSEAQRRYLLDATEPRWPMAVGEFYTYPPSNTHKALMARSLVDQSGLLLRMGLRVKAHLEADRGKG